MKEELNNLLEIAQQQLNVVKQDATKFVEKDNNSAATRVRTGSMALIKTLKEVRIKVQDIRNS